MANPQIFIDAITKKYRQKHKVLSVDRTDENRNQNHIKLYLNDKERLKLDKVVEELYQAKSIESENIDEFLKFTVFIVLYEYDKNKLSLNEFYRKNKEVYKQNKEEQHQ
ncbi:MAG TPA: hypothetical protein VE524_05240 [Nitrososphaeraceae archaeon]|nr:hypothetical protein [Nitrososphaeraceae archaeon]